VEARKEANWMVYRLPEKPSRELSVNLACLQDCASEFPVFQRDAARRARMTAEIEENSPVCCGPASKSRKSRAAS